MCIRDSHLVAEPVAAEQQGAIGIEGNAVHFDEIGVVGRVLLRPDIAKDFVAARMTHGFGFADFVVILALAHGGMVVSDLANLAAADLVKARIAHVADYGRAVFQNGDRQDAGHPLPFGIAARLPQDFVVGHGDGFADALLGGAGLAFEARADTAHGDLGGLFAGGLAADAVDHEENAALGVDV